MSDNSSQLDFEAPDVHVLTSMLNGYEVQSLIAVGGMGAVYKARQISLDRSVAVKLLPREMSDDEEFRESFQAEAKMMAKLNHPNLVGIFDFGHKEGLLYIIMEYVEGKTLYHSAHGKAIIQTTAAKIVQDILLGLEHAHEAGILHRDIKPVNILLGPDAIPKLGDFGLARPTTKTETGVIYGSPGYVAPEVMGDPESVDERTDIFAVGVIFYELLTGEIPDGDEFEPASEKAECDPRFDKVISRAVHPDMKVRYPSAEAMHEDIEKIRLAMEEEEEDSSSNPLLKRNTVGSDSPKLAVSTSAKPATNLATPASSSAKPPASQGPPPTVDPTGGSPLMRNIIIIIILVGAIFVVKDLIKTKKERIAQEEAAHERKNEEILKARKRAAEEEAAAIEAKVNAHQNELDAKLAAQKGNGIDSLKYLESIKSQLVAGEIPEVMPDGTFSDDTSHYLYIPNKMTWYEADAWCLSYGGQLAITPRLKEFLQLRKKLPESADRVWLGLGTKGDTGWVWMNGSAMAKSSNDGPTVFETTNLEYAAFNFAGDVSPNDPKERYPFYIQWSKKGRSPMSVAKRLRRTGESLTNKRAKYPVGSVSSGGRVYSVVGHYCSWDEASDLAGLAGGELYVPSSEKEFKFVSRLMAKLPSNMDVWIGGQNIGSNWVWYNGEEWKNDHWESGYPRKGNSLATSVASKGLFVNYPSSSKLSGFIIEWDGSGGNAVSGKFGELKTKARTLVGKIQADRSKQIEANIKKLHWDLDAYARSLTNEKKEAVRPEVESLQARLASMRLIAQRMISEVEQLDLRDLVAAAYSAQQKLEYSSIGEIEKIEAYYLKNLTAIGEELKAGSDPVQSKLVERELQRLKSSEGAFLHTLNL